MVERKDALRNRERLIQAAVLSSPERVWTRHSTRSRYVPAFDDAWRGLLSFFETTADRQASDRGIYQALAGQGWIEAKVRIWPHIIESVTALFERATNPKAVSVRGSH